MLNVRHISTSGLFDLLTKNVYHTRWSHVDNSHQVWSWYNHPLPSYDVLSANMSRDLVTLTFDLLTLSSCPAWRVTWPNFPQSFKTLRLSVLELWVIKFPVGYHWKCVRGHCTCAVSRDPWLGGQNDYIFGIPDPDLRIHYTTSIGLRRRLRVVYSRASPMI